MTRRSTAAPVAEPPGPPLLSTAQVAEYLGVPEQTLRYWRHLGPEKVEQPRSFRVGSHVRYDPADVAEYVAEQKRKKSKRAAS